MSTIVFEVTGRSAVGESSLYEGDQIPKATAIGLGMGFKTRIGRASVSGTRHIRLACKVNVVCHALLHQDISRDVVSEVQIHEAN